ncbi:unnamed protein product, partial [Coregonus sp. 'balchen']
MGVNGHVRQGPCCLQRVCSLVHFSFCRLLSLLFAIGTICYKCITGSTLTHSAYVCSYRAEPKKKKKVDPRRAQMVRETELIPIEDFITSAKCMDEARVRCTQHRVEMEAVGLAVEAQRDALEELRLESEELYQASLRLDPLLVPFNHQGPNYTRPRMRHLRANTSPPKFTPSER